MRKIIPGLFCLISLCAIAQPKKSLSHQRFITGTYTGGKSTGIYLYDFDLSTGKATLLDSAATANPSFISLSENGKYAYAVNELGAGKGSGSISSFEINNTAAFLKKINEQPTLGDDPCYVAIDRTGKWLVAGNYSGGNFSIMPVAKNGVISSPSFSITHTGKSINKERQEKPHVHCTLFSPDNKFLLVADLGTDKIVSYRFNEQTGSVNLHKEFSIKPGAGPRHICFHPNGQFVYITEEMAGNVSCFSYKNGMLTLKQTISALPKDYSGPVSAADIHTSPDGKFLYSSNRGNSNSIALFSIDKSGLLTHIENESCLGLTPRNFSISPDGKFLLVANQNSDDVVIFRRDAITGKLTDTGNRISVGNPVCLKWVNE
jgi:6-phosphogluconolactonase